MRRLLLAAALVSLAAPACAADFRAGVCDVLGTTMYHLNDDGSLEGSWTVAGQNGNGTEKLMPQ